MARVRSLLPCLGLLVGFALPAQATEILNFSYNDPSFGGGIGWYESGSLSGTLSVDGNTFVPTAFLSLTWQGSQSGVDPGVLGVFGPVVVTLDGSAEDFGTNNGGVYFATAQYAGIYAGASLFGAGTTNGWVQSDWHASIDMPEPASLALFGIAAISLGVVRRRGLKHSQ